MISYIMNVLIVDDSPTCRDTLKQAFAGHAHSCKLFEADNSHDAVQLCKTQSFDIVFMSITMPALEGIEAIGLIRQYDPYVLIIALSTENDEEVLGRALKAGAADFIKEPYDAVLIEKRVYNYLSLANYRRFITGNYTSVSIFNEPVFKRAIVFHISSEDDLSEFWEFFLTHYSINQERSISESFYPAVKVAFDVIEILSRQNKKTTVVYESDDTHSYITVGPTRAINQTLLKELIEHKKHHEDASIEVAFGELKFSLKFRKYADTSQEQAVIQAHAPQEALQPTMPATQIEMAQNLAPKELFIADFFDPEEAMDMHEAILTLESRLNMLQYSKLLPNEALEIADSLGLISKALISYNDFSSVSIAFRSLALDIQENIDAFISNSDRLTKLFIGFLDNLKTWEYKLFVEGVERFDFMNATLIADSQQITFIFCQRSGESEDGTDDIFF